MCTRPAQRAEVWVQLYDILPGESRCVWGVSRLRLGWTTNNHVFAKTLGVSCVVVSSDYM